MGSNDRQLDDPRVTTQQNGREPASEAVARLRIARCVEVAWGDARTLHLEHDCVRQDRAANEPLPPRIRR